MTGDLVHLIGEGGSIGLGESEAAIWAAGHDELRAFITSGNVPSERIFTRAGFAVVAD